MTDCLKRVVHILNKAVKFICFSFLSRKFLRHIAFLTAAAEDHTAPDLPLAEAAALYNTDENFSGWFAQLKADIDAAINKG